MALTRWERFGIDLPERWRRWLDFEDDSARWLRVEEFHENGTLVVRAELPGVDPDKDVDVNVAEGVLHISAKRKETSEQREKGSYRSEFRYGEFSRDLTLPSGVDPDAIKADYKDGILEVRIPWPSEPEAKTTKVAVNRA